MIKEYFYRYNENFHDTKKINSKNRRERDKKNGVYKTHELYYCEGCKRVFQIVYSPIHKNELDYLPSWFPKYQHHRVCPKCKKKAQDKEEQEKLQKSFGK